MEVDEGGVKMKIKTTEIYKLVGEKFRGNMAAFCRELDIRYTTAWRALTGASKGCVKFIPALAQYCKANGLDIADYIEF